MQMDEVAEGTPKTAVKYIRKSFQVKEANRAPETCSGKGNEKEEQGRRGMYKKPVLSASALPQRMV